MKGAATTTATGTGSTGASSTTINGTVTTIAITAAGTKTTASTKARKNTKTTITNSPLRAFGYILYGLVAGFAATVVIVIGCVFLGFLASWILKLFGRNQASSFALMSGFYYMNFIAPVGILVGLVVCIRVCLRRFRQM